MKINYSEFCYSHRLSVDDKEIEEDNKIELDSLLDKLVNDLKSKGNSYEMIKVLLSAFGEYEDTEKCEQCGNYNTIINLEI